MILPGLVWQNMHGVVRLLNVQIVANYIVRDNTGMEIEIPKTALFGKCQKSYNNHWQKSVQSDMQRHVCVNSG